MDSTSLEPACTQGASTCCGCSVEAPLSEAIPMQVSAASTISDSDSFQASDAYEELVEDPGLESIQEAVRVLLQGLGEDTSREGLKDTPKRVAKAWRDITAGYRQDLHRVLGEALFFDPTLTAGGGGLVMVRDIEFASTSEDSLLPFHGRCHIAYVPRDGVVLGLSKFARISTLYARRLQTQERFTKEVLSAVQQSLTPVGVAVIVEARHMAEGAEAPVHFTTATSGCFAQLNSSWLQEFVSLLRLNGVTVPPFGLPNGRSLGDPGYLHAVHCDTPNRAYPRSGSSSVGGSRRSGSGEMVAEQSTVGGGGSQQGVPSRQRRVDGATVQRMVAAVEGLLAELGDDPSRRGLSGGAPRYVQLLLDSTSGSQLTLADIASAPSDPLRQPDCGASSSSSSGAVAHHNSLARARGVEEFHVRFSSQCEHHLLPFYGTAHVAYVPGHSGARLTRSQLEAIVLMYSRRLQIQERFTHQLADAVAVVAGARGAMVVCEALHLCMVARGVEKHASSTTTLAARGSLAEDAAARSELLLSCCLG